MLVLVVQDHDPGVSVLGSLFGVFLRGVWQHYPQENHIIF